MVASSAKEHELAALLRIAGIESLIEEATSGEDADRSKPDPDIVHAALAQARCRPAEALMIGDTPYDIEAASRARMRCIALRCGGYWSDMDLKGAQKIFDSPQQLLDALVRRAA